MAQNFGNRIMAALINSPLHGLMGDSMAVITVTGRKSGNAISTPITVIRDGEGWTATSLRTRTWWRNLRGNAPSQLRVAGKTYAVRGEAIEREDEALTALLHLFEQHPNVAKYFKVKPASDGAFARADVERLCADRVVIRFLHGS